MASFLLGDEYASSSSSSEEEDCPQTSSVAKVPAPVTTFTKTQLLPSADELFSSDTSSVLTTNRSAPNSIKRKNTQEMRPATKIVKIETAKAARVSITAPFAPPQLRRPNISTEDRSSWTSNKTIALQKKARGGNDK